MIHGDYIAVREVRMLPFDLFMEMTETWTR